jgi:hypothetical protein
MENRAKRWIATLGVLVVAALALAPAALGQSSGTGYGGQSGVAGQTGQGGGPGPSGGSGVAGQTGNTGSGVAGETTSGNGSAASQVGAGNGVLAFTGIDIALLAGGGLVLLVTGFGVSRLATRPQH